MLMGKETAYWIELQARCEELGSENLMEDIVSLVKENYRLRGRITFYESRIDQMNVIRKEDIV
jgi:hypothetical protein